MIGLQTIHCAEPLPIPIGCRNNDPLCFFKWARALTCRPKILSSRPPQKRLPTSSRSRSILGDRRAPTMQKNLNLKVKYRGGFRPFAPAVLREGVAALVRARLRQSLYADRRRRPEGQAATMFESISGNPRIRWEGRR